VEMSAYVETVLSSAAWKYSVSAVVGAVIGVLISFIVNCTLVEISINAFFAVVRTLTPMLTHPRLRLLSRPLTSTRTDVPASSVCVAVASVVVMSVVGVSISVFCFC
jgi:hypothetical protein